MADYAAPMARIEVTCVLDCPAPTAAELIARPSTFLHVVRPAFAVANREVLPERFGEGDRFELRLRLLGVLPQPPHHIEIIEAVVDSDGGRAQTRESGGLLRRWNHTLLAEPLPGDRDRTRYTDRVEIEAGFGLTGAVAALSTRFYRHRQRRLQVLAARAARSPTPS